MLTFYISVQQREHMYAQIHEHVHITGGACVHVCACVFMSLCGRGMLRGPIGNGTVGGVMVYYLPWEENIPRYFPPKKLINWQ